MFNNTLKANRVSYASSGQYFSRRIDTNYRYSDVPAMLEIAAQSPGLRFTGTLGLLLRARMEGKIPALRPLLETMQRSTSFRLSQSVLKAALQQVGESA